MPRLSPIVAWLRAHPVGAACLVALPAVAYFNHLIGNRLSGPLAGSGDVSIWEHVGFYVSQNLTFNPLPHLDFSNDQVFFPYGTNSVFQPWGLERDVFFAILFSHVGPGPWLQIYYLLTIFVTLVGTYWLLHMDFGSGRAALAAILVTFFNYYAVHKYPSHLHNCVIHWTTLSIFADFLIVRQVVLRRSLSLRLLLVRALLVSLSLGQDLDYVAGFALMSLTLSVLFIVVLTGDRISQGQQSYKGLFEDARRAFADDIGQHKIAIGTLSVVMVAVSLFYVPLALQIGREAKAFDFSDVGGTSWYASPWRLLLPYFPSFNPVENAFGFEDQPEGMGAGAVGWTLLVLGAGGLWCARGQRIMYVPLLVMLGLLLAYQPTSRPTLKFFPWFAFSRVADRATVVYPVIFASLALSLRLDGLSALFRRGFVVAVLALGVLEAHTAYSFKGDRLYRYSKEFFDYMGRVREQPGEAVLDWPFCVTGSNGIGSAQGLCPYYTINHTDIAYRPYHRKRVIGQYFDRLHPSQLTPFLRAHWERMFVPDDRDIFRARGQIRCFDDSEWELFSEFFVLNDFAGLQLHKSLLPPTCVDEFYRRFGPPLAEVTVPDGDQLAFVAKPEAFRARLDPVRGKNLVFQEPYRAGQLDVLASPLPLPLTVDGLSRVENSGEEKWRWGLGQQIGVRFYLRGPRRLRLRFSFHHPALPEQVAVIINGVTVASFGRQPAWTKVSDDIPFDGRSGLNAIDFECDYWNGKDGKWFAPKDPRPLNIRWTQLLLE